MLNGTLPSEFGKMVSLDELFMGTWRNGSAVSWPVATLIIVCLRNTHHFKTFNKQPVINSQECSQVRLAICPFSKNFIFMITNSWVTWKTSYVRATISVMGQHLSILLRIALTRRILSATVARCVVTRPRAAKKQTMVPCVP